MVRLARRLIVPSIFTLVGCLICASLGNAQEIYRIQLSPPEIENFPSISLYMNIYDSQGEFVHNLNPENLTVIEDGTSLPIKELNTLYPGAQVVVAITPGSSFWIRDARGNSRYEYISEALQKWVEAQKHSFKDDMSLLISNGPEATHLDHADAWLSALQSYQPETTQNNPNLDTLARALEIASDRTKRPGMGRAVLWITSPLQQELTPTFQSLLTRYTQQGVRIFIWLVASAEQFAIPNVRQIEDLAIQSGGKYFAFSGNETIPNLDEFIEPLRNVYHVHYESKIKSSGIHQLIVQVRTEQLQIDSSPLEFEVTVLPPTISFISPPTRIQRTFVEEQNNKSKELIPLSQTIETLIEFPDGYERPLQRTILYVDDEVADENNTSPFDRFVWNLNEYTTTGTHTLRAEVTDSLGLTNSSIEHSVTISIEHPQQSLIVMVSRNRTILAILAVILSGVVLTLVLILGGRIHPSSLPKRKSPSRQRRSDPVTQPVRVQSPATIPRFSTWLNRLNPRQRPPAPKVYAYLTRITEPSKGEDFTPIVITKETVTFGNDLNQANIVLNHPSVEPLHAQLTLMRDGSFKLQDLGSTAGTWVNYMPIPPEGVILHEGDLIHFGGLIFRFATPNLKQVRKLVTHSEESPL